LKRYFVIALLVAVPLFAKDKPNPKLAGVTSIFVKGNNQATEKAREMIENGKTCFTLATKAEDADAVLELANESVNTGTLFNLRDSVVNGTVTLKSGDLVWSKSERFEDAPFRNGTKTAAQVIVTYLAQAADCKARR
jgi:hypothetical protein